jgi:hypothetical protein
LLQAAKRGQSTTLNGKPATTANGSMPGFRFKTPAEVDAFHAHAAGWAAPRHATTTPTQFVTPTLTLL